MTSRKYTAFREKFIADTFSLSDKKRIEYTEGNHLNNVLYNFEAIAKELGLEPMQVLSVYLNKHISSLRNFFKYGTVHSEPIEERVKDIINYLLLMVAMTHKQQKKTK